MRIVLLIAHRNKGEIQKWKLLPMYEINDTGVLVQIFKKPKVTFQFAPSIQHLLMNCDLSLKSQV